MGPSAASSTTFSRSSAENATARSTPLINAETGARYLAVRVRKPAVEGREAHLGAVPEQQQDGGQPGDTGVQGRRAAGQTVDVKRARIEPACRLAK